MTFGLVVTGVPGVGPGAGGDSIAPTVVITSDAVEPVSAAFTATFTFSEEVAGFVEGDITVANAALSDFATADNITFTATVTPTGTVGAITLDIAAGVCTDAAGNENTAAVQLVVDQIVYFLRDEYSVDEAAPMASPHTCDWVGELTLVQTDGNQGASGGVLSMTIPATPAFGVNYWVANDPPARANGQAFIVQFARTAGDYIRVGFHGEAFTRPVEGLYYYGSVIYPLSSETVGAIPVTPDTDFHVLAFVTGDNSLLVFRDNVLIWVEVAKVADNCAFSVNTYDAAASMGYIRARVLGAPWSTEYGIASVNVASPVSGTEYTATADGIFDLTVTAPDPLANTCALQYRFSGDDYWTAYFDAAGAFNLDSVVDGVATNRVAVAGVIAAGETQTIRVIATGSLHDGYTKKSTETFWTKRGSQVNLSHQNAVTTVKPVAGVGWTLGALRCFPRSTAAYDDLADT